MNEEIKNDVEETRAPEPKAKKAKKEKIKKKRGFCFHCCLSLLIFNFVCTCVLIGVGWFFGDQFSRQYLDMSLTETFGVVTGLTKSNGNFIDANHAPRDGDEEGFYDALGDSLFLKENVIKPDELKEAVVTGLKSEDGDVGASLGDYLGTIMVYDNFNQEKIDSIDENNPEANYLVVEDYKVAAFINGILGTALDSFVSDDIGKDAADMGIDMKGLSLKDYVKVEQLKFETKPFEIEGAPKDVTVLGVTVSVGFGQMLREIQSSLDVDKFIESVSGGDSGMEQFSSLIRFGLGSAIGTIKAIMPQKFYATFEMGLSDPIEPKLNFNNMDDAKMGKLYNLLKKFDLDIQDELHKLFVAEGGDVRNALENVNQTVPLSEIIKDGEIKCDAYQLALDLSGVNEGQEEKINSTDILQVLKLILSDNSQYLEEIKDSKYSYKNVQFKRDAQNNFVFDKDGLPIIEEQGKQYYVTTDDEIQRLASDYEHLFISSFKRSYGINIETIDEFINKFMPEDGSEADPNAIIGMFDTEAIKDILSGKASGVVITDKMLAALLNKMLPEVIGQGDLGIDSDALGIEFICIKEEDDKNLYKHHLLDLALRLDVRSLLESAMADADELIKTIVGNLLPTGPFVVEAQADITFPGDVENYVGNPEDFPYFETEIYINGKSASAINKLLMAFDAFGSDQEGNRYGLGSYLDQNVLSELRKILTDLKDILPDLTLDASALKLPNVYEAIAVAVNQGLDQDDPRYVNPSSIEGALQVLTSKSPLDEQGNKYSFYVGQDAQAYYDSCSEALKDELADKYCLELKTGVGNEKYNLEQILHILGVIQTDAPGAAAGKKIYDLVDADGLKEKAQLTGDWENELKVKITNVTHIDNVAGTEGYDMLTALVREVLSVSDIEFVSEDNLLFVKISEEENKKYLNVVMKFGLKDLLPDVTDDNKEIIDFVKDLLPDSHSLITAKVDLDGDGCKIILNDLPDGSEALFDLLKNLGIDLDFNSIGNEIRNAINTLEDNNSVNVQLTSTGMEVENLFALVSGALGEDLTAQDVKFLLNGVLNSEPVEAAQEDDFRNWYYTDSRRQDMRYNQGEDSLKVDFGEILNSKLLDAYALTSEDDEGTSYSLADTMAMFGLGESDDTVDIMSRIDALKFENLVFGTIAPTKVEARELGALITTTLSDFISGGIISADDIMYVKVNTEGDSSYLTIAVMIDIADKFAGSAGDAQELINQLLPEKASLTVKIDITEGKSESEYAKTEVKYNDHNADDTDDMLNIISRATSSEALNLDGLSSSIRDSLGSISEKIGVSYGENTLDLPDIFTVVNKLVLNIDDVSNEDMQSVMQSIFATSENNAPGSDKSRREEYEEGIVGEKSDDYDSFIGNIMDCYFFDSSVKEAIMNETDSKFNKLYDFVGQEGIASIINITGNDGLAHTAKTLDELTPVIPAADLSAVMREHMPDGMGIYAINTFKDSIEMYVSIALKQLFKVKEDNDNLGKLISVDVLYVKLTAHIDELLEDEDGEKYYGSEITINNMSEEQKDILIKVVSSFGATGEGDFDKFEHDVGVAIKKALSVVENACGEGNFSVTEEGIRLVDIFTLLADKVAEGHSGEDVRKVIQGMYETTNATDSKYNFNVDDIKLNDVNTEELSLSALTSQIWANKSLLDKDLGAFVNYSLKTNNIDDVTVAQLSILAASPTQGSNQEGDREKFGSLTKEPLNDALANGKSFVLITVETNVSKMGEVVDGNLKKLLPERMYVTFILEFDPDKDEKFTYVDLIINHMDNETKELLFDLTKIDNILNNIKTVIDECTKPINELFHSIGTWAAMKHQTVTHRLEEVNNQGTARGRYSIG